MSIEINGAGVITGVDSLSTPAVTNTAGSASAPSITFTGDTNTGVYSPGADQVAISTGGSGRLFVDANGRLGIGASPAFSDGGASLQLYTNGPNTSASVGNAAVTLQSVNRNANLNLGSASTGTSSIFFHDQSGLGTGNAPARIACTISEKNLLFETGGVPGSSLPQERLRITSAGLVGVGTSSPGYPLTVKTTTDGGQAILDLDNQDVGNYGGLRVHLGKTDRECRLEATYGSSFFSFYTDNAERMRITSGGNVGIGTTSPTALLTVNGTGVHARFQSGAASDGRVEFAYNTTDVGFISATDANTFSLWARSGNALSLGAGGLERARIDSSGRLLVGTSNHTASTRASFTGHSSSSTGEGIVFLQRGGAASSGNRLGDIRFSDNSDISFAGIAGEADGTVTGGSKPGRLVFSTTADGASSPTERLRINSSGNLMVGTASDQLNGIGAPAALTAFNNGSRFGANFGASTTSSQYAVVFSNPNGQIGGVSLDGTSTSYVTSSDYRLKENVVAFTDGIARLQQLKPSRFNFIADPDKTVDGFLAHEVQSVVPEAINGVKDEVDADGNPVYQGIDQSKLVPLLTAALQEAIGEIESLKARVTALETP